MSGRKSKHLINDNIKKTWQTALYIRLSQEDEELRKNKTGKQ